MNEGAIFLIEPRDPLIARDGRPARLGEALATLPFPPPGMIAGAARTRMASIDGAFSCAAEDLDRLVEIPVHGPLLAELKEDGDGVACWFAPAPRDAVLFGDGFGDGVGGGVGDPEIPTLRRLAPRPVPHGALAGGFRGEGTLPEGSLLPAFASPGPAGKPLAHPPVFWRWSNFAAWLGAEGQIEPAPLGLGRIEPEPRAHLAIEPGGRVGLEGRVFETLGLRFLAALPGAGPLAKLAVRRLALGLRTPGGTIGARPLELRKELAPLGGERRLARWRPATGASWPALPPEIRKRIVETRRARIVLLTPAEFEEGSRPGWNGGEIPGLAASAGGVTVTVQAACVPRAEVVSGWDLRRGKAKPTRRLVPAGSVYWVELSGTGDLGAWCDALWLQPASDAESARRNGYGLAALGVWEEES
ncbi:MAG: type III-B CRISPR module-associated Cmr3 family protein [Acidobacteriota bacterium]